jgi:hypothetical protein
MPPGCRKSVAERVRAVFQTVHGMHMYMLCMCMHMYIKQVTCTYVVKIDRLLGFTTLHIYLSIYLSIYLTASSPHFLPTFLPKTRCAIPTPAGSDAVRPARRGRGDRGAP